MKIKRNLLLAMFAGFSLLSGCGDVEPEYVDISVQHAKTQLAAGGLILEKVQEAEYEKLAGMDGVIRASFYGQSSEISYYYQEGKDYTYNMSMSGDEFLDRITVLNDNQKMKSAALLTQADLKAGKLPEHTFDVIMYSGDENLIGQEFLIYFKGTMASGTEDFVGFRMRISGIQIMEENQLFFSEDFCRQMGMWVIRDGSLCAYSPFLYARTKGDYGIYTGEVHIREYTVLDYGETILFFDDSLKEKEIVLSDIFLAVHGSIMDSVWKQYGSPEEGEVFTAKRDLFPGSIGMKLVSKEFYEEYYEGYCGETSCSYIAMLRVEKKEAERICRELTEKGYEGIVWK